MTTNVTAGVHENSTLNSDKLTDNRKWKYQTYVGIKRMFCASASKNIYHIVLQYCIRKQNLFQEKKIKLQVQKH